LERSFPKALKPCASRAKGFFLALQLHMTKTGGKLHIRFKDTVRRSFTKKGEIDLPFTQI
jgi:hypothetical protein